MPPGPISTLYVLGFPVEVLPRDLKNFCRFLPGFVAANVPPCQAGQAPALFVKFTSSQTAVAALNRIHGQPFDLDDPALVLKAELARRDMDVSQPTPGFVGAGAGYAQHPPSYAQHPPKRPLAQTLALAPEDEICTLTVLGTTEKGISMDSLQEWFQSWPGCVGMQINEKIDGIFAKFESRAEAEQCIMEANKQNLGVEWARRNLDLSRECPPAAAPAAPAPAAAAPSFLPAPAALQSRGAPAAAAAAQAPWKRPRMVDGGELKTITVLGMTEKGLSQDELDSWFRKRPGFQGLQVNGKVDGMFVKFATGADAEKAMVDANNMQYKTEWARRNLDLGKEEMNTITILGAKEKGLSMAELQEWFQQRPGFHALKVNERIDGLFVRFLSNSDAAQALLDAGAMEFPAEWARRNLD